MKKPAKAASKKSAPVKKPAAKAPVKKPAFKKAAPAKKPAAKKAAPVKKPAAKKVAPVKKPAAKKVAPVKKPAFKKVAPVKKPIAKKAVPAKKPVAPKKPVKPLKAAPVKAESKKELKAKAKAEKVVPVKKLTKKEEKELLKAKGKKGASFEEELEEGAKKSRFEEEDDFLDEDFSGTPKKVKMTFDEDLEEEIPVRKKKSSFDDDIKENLAEEILALSEDFSLEDIFSSIRNMELFKIETDECVVRGCDNPATTSGYCRYHYIKLWKDVKKKQLILSEGRLAKIIEELVRKYPMKYVETIMHDLADDKAFNHVLKDLDIETDEAEIDAFDDDELLDDDQDIAFETKVIKPSFDD